jgi:hypothetical protein
MQIVQAVTSRQLAEVRELFEEYWMSFGFTPCFQNFGAELAGLPGGYAPPGGRLALALVEGQPAGCAALRRLDGNRCEFKRLYRQLLCDTMPVMAEALSLYEHAGFARAGPYSGHATPGAIFLRLELGS